MARHKIYVYRDTLANIYNVLGGFICLMGLFSLLNKNLSVGFVSLLPMLTAGVFGFLFQESGAAGGFALVIALLPSVGGLILLLRSSKMSPAERALFI